MSHSFNRQQTAQPPTSVSHRVKRPVGATAAVTLVGGTLMIGSTPVSAATLTVDTLSDNPADGLTLREAIDASVDGDTIDFDPTLFSGGPAVIDLTAFGRLDEADSVTLVGPGSDLLTLTNTAGDILYIYDDASVRLSGVTLDEAGNHAIALNGDSRLVATDINITDAAVNGIYGSGPIDDLILSEVTITGSGVDGVRASSMDLMWVADSQIDDNGDDGLYVGARRVTVTNSSIDDNGDVGIYMNTSGDEDFTIIGSTVDRNEFGFVADYPDDVTIDSTSFSGNLDTGIYIDDTIYGDLTIRNQSTISDNVSYGVYIDDDIYGDLTISDSTISDNGDDGFYMDDDVSGDVTITNAMITGNGGDGLDIDDGVGGNVTVTGSTITGNGGHGLEFNVVDGVATVTDSVFEDNDDDAVDFNSIGSGLVVADTSISSSIEGGISATNIDGDVSIVRTVFDDLGGVAFDADTVSGFSDITESTFSNVGDVPVFLLATTAGLTVVNSTVTGATATAALDVGSGPIEINHSTITGNTFTNAAIATTSGITDVDHSIVTDNTDPDVFAATGPGTIAITNSLVPIGTGLAGSTIETDTPDLGALGDNGGPTPTMLPLPGSAAIDAGDPAIVGPPATDQRGAPRVNGTIDIGSVEVGSNVVSLAIDELTVAEDGATAELTVTRTGTDGPVSVDVQTADGTATGGSDFTAVDETLTWANGDDAPRTVTVPILDDTEDESDETLTLALSTPVNATLGTTSSATITITDDDEPVVVTDDVVTSLNPARFADTRSNGETIDGVAQATGKLSPGGEITVPMAGRGDVPADAVGVVMNVTAIGAETTGFVTAYPCSDERPLTSSLNYTAGVNLGNEIIAGLSADGEVCLYSSAAAHLSVDVVGYVSADSPLVNVDPARILDTRATGETVDDLDIGAGKTAPQSSTTLQVAGRANVPADAAAVIVNVTAVGVTDTGFVTVTPCVDPLPTASSLNYSAGANRGNELVAGLTDDGEICLFTSSSVHLTVDVVGYLPAGTNYEAVDPARFLDTRAGTTTVDSSDAAAGRLAAGEEYELQIAGRGDVPADATAVIANVTAIRADGVGFVTVHPCANERPLASSLNYVAGVNGGNEIIAQLSPDGKICLFTSAATDLAVDVVAYLR